eukprot:6960053-Prymnesium_polylepis.1
MPRLAAIVRLLGIPAAKQRVLNGGNTLLAALAACGARSGAPDDTVCALASRSSHALLSSRFIGDGPCASVDRGLAGPVGSPLGSVGSPPVDGGSCALAGP